MKFSNDPIHALYFHDEQIKKSLKEDSPLNEAPTISEFFANRELFMTGGTGFVGKALIEKLLRSCPEIKSIFMLLRPKKGQSVMERLRKTCESAIFDVLRLKLPNFIDKLVPVIGDVGELNLGISDDDRLRLAGVSVVFHSAAIVRFDSPLRETILMNTRGTLELLKLCESLKQLKVILHVSTAYSNSHVPVIEEKIYPKLAEWRKIIEICENFSDNQIVDVVTSHLTSFVANTYTFSKHLAEQVLNDYKDKLPIAIVRPTVVIGPVDEPIPGFVDNLNGPVGSNVGIGTGLLRVAYGDPDKILDAIPADIIIKGIIMAAWKRAHGNSDTLLICNAAFSPKFGLKVQQMADMTVNGVFEEFPFGKYMVFLPGITFSMSKKWILVQCFFLQLLPAMILDFILTIKGKKKRIMKIQRKAFDALKPASYFVTHDWQFKIENFESLSSFLRREDVKDFDIRKYDLLSPILLSRINGYGIRKYLLKMKDEDLEKDRKRYRNIKNACFIAKIFLFVLIFYIIKSIIIL